MIRFALTSDWVPQSVNGKLKVTMSVDLVLGWQLWLWPEGIHTVSMFRGGTEAFWEMLMLKPSLLQKICLDTDRLSPFISSVENTQRLIKVITSNILSWHLVYLEVPLCRWEVSTWQFQVCRCLQVSPWQWSKLWNISVEIVLNF